MHNLIENWHYTPDQVAELTMEQLINLSDNARPNEMKFDSMGDYHKWKVKQK
jgi:hypothetical protein